MRRLAGRGENAFRFAHQWTESSEHRSSNKFSHRLTALAAAGFVCAMLSSIAIPARAVEANSGVDQLSALRSYAQQISIPAARADRKADDQALGALQNFAQRLGTAPAQSIKDLPKVAEAPRTLFEFFHGTGTPTEAPHAAPPVKKTTAGRGPYIGSKACATCHAPLIAEFNKTLMGKIG